MPPIPKPEAGQASANYYLIVAAALYVFIQAFSLLAPILLSFILTLLISLAVNPVIARMRTSTGGRKGATGLVAMALVVVIGLTAWAAFVPMKDSVTEFAAQLPKYWERLQKPLIRIETQAVRSEEKLQAQVDTEIAQADAARGVQEAPRPATDPVPAKTETESGSIRSGLGEMLQGVLGSFSAVAFNTAQILVVLVTVFFGVIFTLMNPRPIFGAMFSLVPARHHEKALRIAQRIGTFVPGWAGATLFGMLTIGLLVVAFMWPIFGLMDALMLGLIAGIFEAVPFVGPLLSAVPALLLALGEGGMAPVWVVLAYSGIQAIENNLLVPFVMARGMKLHPVAVIFSVLLCVAAFGVLGVLIAAPLVAIVDILHDELYRKRFLPTVTDADLDRLARMSLHESSSVSK